MATLYPILPDTVTTVLSPYWSRVTVPSDADAMDPEQHAALVLTRPLSHSVTVLHEDRALCVAGVVPLTATVGVIFLFRQSPHALQPHAMAVARALRRAWMGWRATPSWYAEVQCRANMGDPAIDRLLRWLGFTPTGHLTASPHGYALAGYRWCATEGDVHVYRP